MRARGRPRKPNALTPAERTRRYRARRRAMGLSPRVVWTAREPAPAAYAPPSLREQQDTRRHERQRSALAAAKRVLGQLRRQGVRAGVFGSLARGRFGLHSDVDFLVLECPAKLRYRIEAGIEDSMAGLPFDVAYLDELTEPWRSRALAEVREESGLR